MKRRVLRAHANKRCLRILSASHLIHASYAPSSSAVSGDRGYAILCDASFLRAVLLSYWQANAPAMWREARRRKLRKAAATAIEDDVTRTGDRSALPAPSTTDRITASTVSSMARLPFGDVPALSPGAFLAGLLFDAFQSGGAGPAASGTSTAAEAALASTFHCYCLPETMAALHRMRELASALAASSAAGASPVGAQKRSSADSKRQRSSTPPLSSATSPHSEQRRGRSATEAWLGASFGKLTVMDDSSGGGGGGAHRHVGPFPSSTAFPLTFQEVPAVVVNHLLSRITLIQLEEQHRWHSVSGDSRQASGPTEKAASTSLPMRNESRAIGEFMAANDTLLGRRPREGIDALDASACDLSSLRLVSMPLFSDRNFSMLSSQSAAAKRRRRKHRKASGSGDNVGKSHHPTTENASVARTQEVGGDGADAAFSTASRPFSPRAFFVATQSHDVRRRLAAVTPLLRLTTNPDALWIEQRGTAYHYDEEGTEGRRPREGSRAASGQPSSSAAAAPSSWSGLRSSEPRSARVAGYSRAPASPHAPATAVTVVAAAPQLSRADVAFMRCLGAASEVALPGKVSHHLHQQSKLSASPATGNKASGIASADRKRRRQKGQNPLSMKKKRRREVFRAN
ncbi:hypothetical protein LSCM1_07852 [Leishmania martiniquensis]|uniref:UTP23 sensor motif region domain-containing protein n=1 Tax=Leishmania martiniquensis TaxID=1580590 RepID=A0A836GM12_9TRYP|nr:hypothetical protein LSCM1_07852 [Leishmania martiniquensis]